MRKSIDQAKAEQAEAINIYLKEQYGDEFFDQDDRDRMEYLENGDVMIGIATIQTGIKLDF